AKIQREIFELTTSIAGLVAGFKKLKRPLAESHEKVPQATDQLDKISEQTEAAAHQMLDQIEHITQREDELIKCAEQVKAKIEDGETTEAVPMIDNIVEMANNNLNDAYMIMDSLQFQDITAQQMDHAASILEDIEIKLDSILATMGDSVRSDREARGLKKNRAYDPHADLFARKTNQEDIDSLFEKKQ
ncbi:MAG: protein phosphatase CheZ, partial [Deltaproteobacteria bacterium]|nr:protein phosphatase CheZ [Deltaproteobacteria bacterium]